MTDHSNERPVDPGTDPFEAEYLRRIAYTDELTGLPNRLAITEHLDHLTETQPGNFAVWFIDVDGLKAVNDTEGHEAGNELIRSVARALIGNGFYGHMSARLSGDEFVVVWEVDPFSELSKQEQLSVKNHEIKQSLEEAGIEASTGATLHTPGQSATDLIEIADQAMYLDKEERRTENHVQIQATERARQAEERSQAWAALSPEQQAVVAQARALLASVAMSPVRFSWLVSDDDL